MSMHMSHVGIACAWRPSYQGAGVGEFSGPLIYEGSYAWKAESRVVLLQVFDGRKVSLHLYVGVPGLMSMYVRAVVLMCTTECLLSWRPFTVTWRREGVVGTLCWYPMVSSAGFSSWDIIIGRYVHVLNYSVMADGWGLIHYSLFITGREISQTLELWQLSVCDNGATIKWVLQIGVWAQVRPLNIQQHTSMCFIFYRKNIQTTRS